MSLEDRIKPTAPAKAILIGAAGAIGLWIGFPNQFGQFPPAVFLWPLALLFLGHEALSAMSAFRRGWCCTFAGMLFTLYWLYLPLYTVGQLPLPAALGCALLICACLAAQGALFCLGSFLFKGWGVAWTAPLLALLWYLLEYFFALIIGVPWLPLCGALAAWPVLLQGASFAGGYALGALWLLGILLLLPLPYARCGKRNKALPRLAGTLLLCALLLFGIFRLQLNPEKSDDAAITNKMTALFIEGNVDQNQKWDPLFQTSTLDLYMRLSREALEAMPEEDKKNLLLLWPETALPFFLETNRPLTGRLLRFVADIREPLLFGAPGMEEGKNPEDSAVFNRAYLINPDGRIEGFYDKEHLVPFGEYAPAWLRFKFLEPLLQGVGIYEAGRDSTPLRHASLALGMLICYEGIFPWLAQERVEQGANLLVDISNDGWFGKTPAPLQHLYLTIARCVEQNRWLLRSTNTGISAIADNLGRVRLSGASFRSGYIYGDAWLKEEKSLYHAYADYLPWAALCLFILMASRLAVKAGLLKSRPLKNN